MKVGKADGLNWQAAGSISRVSSEFLAILWGSEAKFGDRGLEAAGAPCKKMRGIWVLPLRRRQQTRGERRFAK